jgi:hypothetical protein
MIKTQEMGPVEHCTMLKAFRPVSLISPMRSGVQEANAIDVEYRVH